MPLDIAQLAQDLTTFLAPALPYLQQVGSKVADGAAEKVGADSWDRSKKVWERLWPKVEAKEAAREAVEDLVAEPEDTEAAALLRRQLVKILTADVELAQAIARLMPPTINISNDAVLYGNGAIGQGESVVAGAGGTAVRVGAGNVTVNNFAPQPADDSEALLRDYLRYVIEKTGHLSLSGVDPAVASRREAETRLSLSALYTGLWTQTPRQRDKARGEDPRRLMEGGDEHERASALELLDREERLVLLGDPGSGKSTFVSFVALCLAGEGLGRDDVNLTLLMAPMPDDGGDDVEERQPWRHEALVPVRVVLRDFAARGLPEKGKATAQDLWRFITAELAECKLDGCAPLLEQKLRSGKGLLLLDGLDEVPEAEDLRDQILAAVKSFCEGFSKCRVVVTSRTYAYQKQEWQLTKFTEAVLAPFSDGQIRRFVRRWYAHVASVRQTSSEAAAGRAELLERAIFSSDRLYYLAARPLLLTLMSSLHSWRGGNLPERREELYANTIDLLLDVWERQRFETDRSGKPTLIQPSLAEWLKVDREKVRTALEELAYKAHAEQEKPEGTADLDEGKVVARLMRLGEQGKELNPTKLVSFLRERAGILEPRGVGVYTFPHRTFQEYLAACHLTGDTFPDEVATLARTDPERWREVVLLAGAKAARGAVATVWDLAEALCFREVGSAEREEADLWGALFAGEALAESANLETMSERHRPRLERVRSWLLDLMTGAALPARERARAGATLARLGDPRLAVTSIDGMEFCPVPAGEFVMGSPDNSQAWESETPSHRLDLSYFQMARYPVTVAQFREFLAASGQDLAHPGIDGELSNHPVRNVTWGEVLDFCEWLTARWRESGRLSASECVVLPSEAEWEKAARGCEGQVYPWGNQPDPERANYGNTGIGGPSAVGCFSGGGSPYGCEEMEGNVWEWTRSVEGAYPYEPSAKSENLNREKGLRVLRGGSFNFVSWGARCACRGRYDPGNRWNGAGFRVALCPFPLDSEPSEL